MSPQRSEVSPSFGTVTARIGALSFDALGLVARYGNCTASRAPGWSLDEGEGHCDVELTSGPVPRAGHGRAALQPHDTAGHGRFEAPPMGRPQMVGDDQVKLLTGRFRGAVAEQGGGGMVPPHDRSRSVGKDNGIGDLFDDRFSQRRRVFHKLTASVEYCSAG